MVSEPLQLIVGLGNPTEVYKETRHNAGQWFLDRLLDERRLSLARDKKFKGLVGRIPLDGNRNCYVFKPTAYMNESGQSVRAIVQFYHIPIQSILIVHDDLDLPIGVVRLKQGGGHGGHNGLRSVIQELGSAEFGRLRLGIDHPGNADEVISYVLNRPSRFDRNQIDEAIGRALEVMPLVLEGHWQKAMTLLNG